MWLSSGLLVIEEFRLERCRWRQTPVIYGNDPGGDCVGAAKHSQQQEENKGQRRNWNLGSRRDKPETSRGGWKLEQLQQVDVVGGRTPDPSLRFHFECI